MQPPSYSESQNNAPPSYQNAFNDDFQDHSDAYKISFFPTESQATSGYQVKQINNKFYLIFDDNNGKIQQRNLGIELEQKNNNLNLYCDWTAYILPLINNNNAKQILDDLTLSDNLYDCDCNQYARFLSNQSQRCGQDSQEKIVIKNGDKLDIIIGFYDSGTTGEPKHYAFEVISKTRYSQITQPQSTMHNQTFSQAEQAIGQLQLPARIFEALGIQNGSNIKVEIKDQSGKVHAIQVAAISQQLQLPSHQVSEASCQSHSGHLYR